ncbi:hypothetical protein FHR22_004269 [Sphingopyxis panaciterrae]|uniref:hypothetical protein n=1 Tax=Sphingopyxis panaciterrae TaxID=363841 RepID=UPI00141F917B|nr:hypothetical protein [Sphingopyxis panaciterrae]NIJ39519.1 hypothetical protein [Sphingopyxis panaciterrae]
MLTKAGLLAENRAIYLPAISANYADFARNGTFKRPMAGLVPDDLDFLRPDNRYFSYPFALYSAGQVIRTPTKLPKACMVARRDRGETIVLGDSGGFQVSKGTIEFEKAETARRMLKWMEGVADWSMVLDFPTGGIAAGFMKEHVMRLLGEGHNLDAMCKANGQSLDFNACLLQTKINNDQFVAERTHGATGLLNVLQGRNEAESKAWYEAVKHYPFEGIAFAGAHQNNFSLLLRRLYDLHQDGLLHKCGWVHVLGVSTLDVGCLLSKVQRCVRQYWGYEDFQVSFDSASPFINAANNGMIVGQALDSYGWTVRTTNIAIVSNADTGLSINAFCAQKLGRKTDRLGREMIPAISEVGNMLHMTDLCVGKAKVAGQRDKSGLDVDSSYLLMRHNVQAFVAAHDQAHDVFFGSEIWRVPVDTATISGIIDVMFKGEPIPNDAGSIDYVPLRDPIRHINECEVWLDRLAAQRSGAVLKNDEDLRVA